ncbi:hypothetical protein [Desulfosporosinus shakirovi]|uniref:hypothetical protein n=1 Tax=Desulfosporosinus shakirovi TaxID=2885154 RepID=UPI001E60C648|nr:hypothetical protein [Desulfosporosinus sp. SRJS8]MCB8817079.1 hypothetical protein [Desulfosporosinus sp. SRJS8]
MFNTVKKFTNGFELTNISGINIIFGVQAETTPKLTPSNSTNNLSQNPPDTISKATKEEAINKTPKILSELSLKSAELKKADISKDPVTAKEYWDIQFEGASKKE